MFPIYFHEKAKKELEDSVQWYERQKENLGDRFEQTIYETLDAIQKNPELFAFIRRPFRQALVKTFPYAIVYKIDEKNKRINILAVNHSKRNPKYKFRKF